MAASVNPSFQIQTVKRFELPMFAASDIVQGAAVRLASSGDWAVQMCQSSAEKPLGIARDYAIAGNPVAVYDEGNVLRVQVAGQGLGASVTRMGFIGVVGTSTAVHPQSGVTVTYGLFGPVSPNITSGAYGASGTTIYAVGTAFESAAVGDQSGFRVEPRLLSGILVP